MSSATSAGNDRSNLFGLMPVSVGFTKQFDDLYSPGRIEQIVAHHYQLRNDTDDIEVRSIGEQKVPQSQDFRQRWRAGAESQYRGKGVDLGGQAFIHQMQMESNINNGEHLVDQFQTVVNTRHGSANIAGNLFGQQAMECTESFHLAAGGI